MKLMLDGTVIAHSDSFANLLLLLASKNLFGGPYQVLTPVASCKESIGLSFQQKHGFEGETTQVE